MDLQEFAVVYRRPATGDVRFSVPMILAAIGAEACNSRALSAVGDQLLALGARQVGKARVNTDVWGTEQMKDNVYSVAREEWLGFVERLSAAKIDTTQPRVARKAVATKGKSMREELAELRLRVQALEAQQ